MSRAETISSTTRRSALRFGLGATVAGLITPAIAAPSADVELLDLCRLFDDDSRALQHFDALAAATGTHDDDELDDLLDRWHDTLHEITGAHAATIPGIRAKAAALGHALTQCAFIDTEVSVDEQGEDYERLAMSLVRDLAAVAPA